MTRASFRFVALFTAIGLCCALSPAFAQQHTQTAAQTEVGLGFKGLGGSIGLVDPEDASSALALGLHVDAGQIVKNVHLIPNMSYWSVGRPGPPYSKILPIPPRTVSRRKSSRITSFAVTQGWSAPVR